MNGHVLSLGGRLILAALLITFSIPASGSENDLNALGHRYHSLLMTLIDSNPEQCGSPLLIQRPDAAALTRQLWETVRAWTLAEGTVQPSRIERLNDFAFGSPFPIPCPGDNSSDHCFQGGLCALDASGTPLDDTTTVVIVSIPSFEVGTFFVVSRDANMLSTWSVDESLAHRGRTHPAARAWSPEVRGGLRGLLPGSVIPLPRASNGHLRFAIDAVHTQAMGMTVLGNLSIWEWNGSEAVPLLVRNYVTMLDDDRQIAIDGESLIVPTKEETQAMSTGESSSEPAGLWTIAICPDHIEDRGQRTMERQ